MSLTATALTPGDAVTVWWAVFNHPENCRTTSTTRRSRSGAASQTCQGRESKRRCSTPQYGQCRWPSATAPC